MEEALRQNLKKFMGMPDSDIDKVSLNIQKILASFPKFRNYQIVAEVTDSRYCAAGIKQGQRYVFSAAPPVLLAQKSDCPLCLRALGPLTSFVNNIMDRIAEGSEPGEAIFRTAECLDPGLEHGGLGKVYFKVYAQRQADK